MKDKVFFDLDNNLHELSTQEGYDFIGWFVWFGNKEFTETVFCTKRKKLAIEKAMSLSKLWGKAKIFHFIPKQGFNYEWINYIKGEQK